MASGPAVRLEARAVTMRLGDVLALDGVDLAFEGRVRIALLGANGAGKSVLLRTLHGLMKPTTGEVAWSGEAPPPHGQAMVFQRPVLLRRSALGNVEYALAVNGVRDGERATQAAEALARVRLSHVATRSARTLSGGEQQRLAIARAWALRPRMLFLDEPTSNLDPTAAGEIERLMGEVHEAGTALVFSTHHLGLARRAADEIVFLHRGRVAERTPADLFFRSPRSPEAASYLQGELP
ncbi:MAG TPA: ATP-binding cassette domain-containing protein [Usitatibacter sp.]|nr:ATP-binding cassette domain-containing protein [Usitatibacter sp.]